MKKKEQRINDVMSLIREQPTISVKNLAEILDVSEMTIRRDLTYLKSSNALTQSLGMNFINSESNAVHPPMMYDFTHELRKNSEVKDRIAQFASSLISPRDILILDSSTTVSKMVPYIPGNVDLTVICYNYHILSQLPKNESLNLIFTGGVYNKQLQMFESSEGINIIKAHRANKFFFSASGIHEQLGMTCSYPFEVLTKRASLSSSGTKILLTDSSKFGVITTSYFAKVNECDIIITDSGISKEWIKIIEDLGIQLHIV
ncbi:DeoR/GlpR family DNA-binding transcription regulator [Faecalicatena contorta]|uniref:Transcriptional regulator, DeoR family n=1 Tax=Faecalicatena contorta TaxID=39482 RepID=A0A315ZQ24_9FIRM|nr:DeoR/GlpR family DNA-binding transcription regulator [Faecalicatena contorta]PWJ47695.1 DeoR family transcriptional regulator [Faecalicatena contorta]SUQ15888.1 transcriptional regulator, DeoR family [Faecalicatena contorta]